MQKLQPILLINDLVLPVLETEFQDYLGECEALINQEPELLKMIDDDLDVKAKEEKKGRLEDKQWERRQTKTLPGFSNKKEKIVSEDLSLEVGRPRMSAYLVFIFTMVRGYLGGIKSQSARVFISESITLRLLIERRGVKMPGVSTILELINTISQATMNAIFEAQLRSILNENLDDFKKILIDSTSIKGNTSWPTDSRILTRLVERIHHRNRSLQVFMIEITKNARTECIIKEMKRLSKSIDLNVGKKNSKKNRLKSYRKLLKQAKMAYRIFIKEFKEIESLSKEVNIKPTQKIKLIRLVELIQEDINSLEQVMDYCPKRVFKEEKIKSVDKVLSLSDKDAAFIKKGDREPKIGFKPQLCRSGNGFVTSLIVPKGNAADSGELDIVIKDHLSRTTVLPKEISTDDGYANTKIRDKWILKGVDVFSISGSKGKNITPELAWESEEYKESRNGRSAVESLMYTIKHNFGFGNVMRRGIENVRIELLEKVISYNFCQILTVRERNRKREREKAAA